MLILEVNILFCHIFETFKSGQKSKLCEVYCKIVKIHNIKFCHDKAMVYTKKMFENLGTDTPTSLTIVLVTCYCVSNTALEKALAIVTKEEEEEEETSSLVGRGENSVLAAKIKALMAANNFAKQYDSTKNNDEARQQAEKAINIFSKKLGKDNFCLINPKSTLADIAVEQKTRANTSVKH